MTDKPKKILLAAGGTGGHMFPAQALAEILAAEGWDVAMMTDARGLTHADKIPAEPILQVEAATLSPRRPIQAVLGVIKLLRGIRQAKAFMQTWKPDVVVGFGGYPAFPTMRAAQSLSLPTLIHEQNAVLGRVNRVFAQKAVAVASGFEVLSKCPDGTNHVFIGNPLREQVRGAVPQKYAAPRKTIHILIVGGSLGARIISEVMPDAIASLPADLRSRLVVTQQTLAGYQERAEEIYKSAGVKAVCEPFFDNIETHLAKAHFIVGRAGASSVSEIAAMGKPSLLIPLKIAMDDHQTENAKALSRLNAADILTESEFTPEVVKTTLERRLNDSTWLKNAARSARSAARPNAARELAEMVKAAAL